MIRQVAALALVFASACFEPGDGQFLCTDDGPCPSGQRCVSGVCRVAPSPVDAGQDGPVPSDAAAGDSALDQRADGDLDADLPPADGGLLERCAPDARGAAVDEDGDGRIDESGADGAPCGWFFGTPHFVEYVNQPQNNFSIAFGDSPLRAYVPSQSAGGPVLMLERENPGRAFADPSPLRLEGTAVSGTQLFTATITGDERLLVAQSESGALLAFERPTRDDAFRRVETLNLPAENAAHPSIQRDGLELYYTQTAPTREVRRLRRSARDLPFGPSTTVVPDAAWPRLSQDGAELVFTRDGGGGTELRRRNDAGDFADRGTTLALPGPEFVSSIYLPAQREMWLVAGVQRAFAHRAFALFRVKVCRDGPCEAEPPPPCPSPAALGPDGFSCYVRDADASGVIGFADRACKDRGPGWHLATISSADENRHLEMLGGASSIGFTREILRSEGVADAQGWQWSSGEPPLFNGWSSPPEGARCASIESGPWMPLPCSTVQPFVCERRELPVWLE